MHIYNVLAILHKTSKLRHLFDGLHYLRFMAYIVHKTICCLTSIRFKTIVNKQGRRVGALRGYAWIFITVQAADLSFPSSYVLCNRLHFNLNISIYILR